MTGEPDSPPASRLPAFLARRWRLVVGAAAAAAVAGAAVQAAHLGDALRYYDERDYATLATSLATTGTYSLDGLHPTAFRPPAWPAVLSLPAALGLGVPGMRAANVLALGATVLLAGLLARRLAGGAAGALASVATAAYPLLFYTAGTLYPQTLAAALLLGALLLLLPDVARRTPDDARRPLLAGLLLGGLVLAVPTFLFTLGLAGLWTLASPGPGRWRRTLALAAGAIVAIAPWTARNLATMGAPIPVSTNSGRNLLLGYADGATATSGVNVDLSAYDPAAERLDEVARDRFYSDMGMRRVLDDPGGAAVLFLEKTVAYFAFSNELATAAEASRAKDLVMVATYGPLLVLLLLRLATWRRLRPSRAEAFLLAVYLLNAPWGAVFFNRLRFRAPLDAVLIAAMAVFVARWAATPRTRPTRG